MLMIKNLVAVVSSCSGELIYDGMIVPSDFVMATSMLRGISRRAQGRLSRTDIDDDARRNGLQALQAQDMTDGLNGEHR